MYCILKSFIATYFYGLHSKFKALIISNVSFQMLLSRHEHLVFKSKENKKKLVIKKYDV